VKFTELDVTLEDDQSDEVSEVVARIEQDCSEELQDVFREAEEYSTEAGSSLCSAWERDKENSKVEFFQDQLKNSKLNCIKWLVI